MPVHPCNQQLLLLEDSESSLSLDKRIIKEAGFNNITVMTSGLEACKKLAGLAESQIIPDIVVCNCRLEDIDGEQFCAIIRQHPRLLGLPILLIMPNESEAVQLKALGCGASALLGRPFSVQTLRDILNRLLVDNNKLEALRKGANLADTANFDSALASYGILLRNSRSPEDYFKAGMRLLEENRYNIAIDMFQRALQAIKIKGEAELGIAVAYKGKGDNQRYHAWLMRSAETFVRAKRWHDARTTFGKILQEKTTHRNPFVIEANRLIREGDYKTAAKTLAEGNPLVPSLKKAKLYANLCVGASDSRAMFHALQEELSHQGNSGGLVSEIRQSIIKLGNERKEKLRKASKERQTSLIKKIENEKGNMPDFGRPSPDIISLTPSDLRGLPIPPVLAGEKKAQEDEYGVKESEISDLSGKENNAAKNALEPLGEEDATSDLFTGTPKINEFFSIIKYTWKMARRNKKKK